MVSRNHAAAVAAGPRNRNLSHARKRWTTSCLMIKCARTFFFRVQVRAHSHSAPCLNLLVRTLEPMLRRLVQEEFQKRIAKLQRQVPRPIDYNMYPRYNLRFLTKLKNVIYTKDKIQGESGGSIQVSIQESHKIVKSGPFASAKVKIVVLHGNFCADARETWTTDEFEKNMVSRRDKKEILLVGDLECSLERGVASFHKAYFNDNSKWAGGGKFRLGVKLIDDTGVRVQEGISNPFEVLHHRGKGSKKPDIPSLKDELWKLKRIAKDGVIHKKLNKKMIFTVQDLLKLKDETEVREILRSNYKTTIQHAKKCVQGNKELVALFSDPNHHTNLPNGESNSGHNEMVQTSNLSSQTDPIVYDIARGEPQIIYNMPGHNEINNPSPPNVGSFHWGSTSGKVTTPEGTSDLAANDSFDANQYLWEPDPAEVDNHRLETIYDEFRKALTGQSDLLVVCKWIKVTAPLRWACITKQSAARRRHHSTCPAQAAI